MIFFWRSEATTSACELAAISPLAAAPVAVLPFQTNSGIEPPYFLVELTKRTAFLLVSKLK
jgi:hypothetical protein